MDLSSCASVGYMFVFIAVVCNVLFSSSEYRLLCTHGVGVMPKVVLLAVPGLEALGISVVNLEHASFRFSFGVFSSPMIVVVSRGIGLVCLAMISFPLGGVDVFSLRLIAAPLSLRKSAPSISSEGKLSVT